MKTQLKTTKLENRIKESAIEKAIDQLHQNLLDYQREKWIAKNKYSAYESLLETQRQLAELKNQLEDLMSQSHNWETH